MLKPFVCELHSLHDFVLYLHFCTHLNPCAVLKTGSNHGIVQRIELDPEKELKSLCVEVIANEVIIGLLGISLLKA